MVSQKSRVWLSKLTQQLSLYVGMSLIATVLGVGIKIDQDIVKLDTDQQATTVAVAKSIDSIPLKLNQEGDISESNLGNELLADLGKHPEAMAEIEHILEAKAAEIQVSSEVDCLALHEVLNREIQTFKTAHTVERLNRVIEMRDFLVRHCRTQPKAQK